MKKDYLFYLSGAITNSPNFRADFHHAYNSVVDLFWGNGEFCPSSIYNPADPSLWAWAEAAGIKLSWRDYMRQDIAALGASRALVLIENEGWEASKGVRVELRYARMRGIPVLSIKDRAGIRAWYNARRDVWGARQRELFCAIIRAQNSGDRAALTAAFAAFNAHAEVPFNIA